ncbi:phage tail tape measure protein [Microbacterium saperdae]|nr:phage tail tape measure protein [Microbacterium saperdae]
MREVGKATEETATKAEKLAAQKQGFEQLGRAALGFGAVAALGVGLAISKWAEFDQQMSYVQAATHETAGNMDLLKEAALDAGARTVFSATEAAGAIEELARAGVSTADILGGGLDASLDLAAAGGLDVAQAAGIAAVALKTFNLQGQDMAHVADLLAAGAGKAMGDVSDLSQALAQGGMVAKQTGLSIEETTAGLAAFASQGLIGSDAGTSFKSMLQRLTPQSAEAQRKMDELGISAYDAGGNFVGLAQFAGNLQTSLQKLTPEQRNAAMATIFGSDAVRAASVLYSEGEQGIREWTEAVNDQGYAAETARLRLDNLAGDVEALGGAFDTALITSGSGANDALRALVQSATGVLDIFGELPEEVQGAGVIFALAAAGVSLMAGAFLTGVPRVAAFKEAVSDLKLSMSGVSIAAGAVTVGLGIVIGVIGAVAAAHAEAQAQARAYADTLERGTQRVTQATRDLAAENLTAEKSFLWISRGSAADAAEELGLGVDTVTDAVLGNAEALTKVYTAVQKGLDRGSKAMVDQTDADIRASRAAELLTESLEGEIGALDEARKVAEQKSAADKTAAAAAEQHESALRELEGGAAGAMQGIDELSDAIRGFGSTELDARAAVRELEAAYDDLAASVAENGASLDITTEAGRSNEAALDAIARKTLEVTASTLSQTGSQQAANEAMAAGRQQLIDMLAQFGITGAEADAYADRLGLIPGNIPTTVQLLGVGEASTAIQQLISAYDGRKIRLNVAINRGASDAELAGIAGIGYTPPQNAAGNLYSNGKQVAAFAAGGVVGFGSNGTPPHIASATNGGLLKYAEAGWDEAFITMNPAYGDRSRDIWVETGRRLGAWQPAPPSYAAAAPQRTTGGNQYTFTGDIVRADEGELVRAMNKEVRRAMAMTGVNEGVSD